MICHLFIIARSAAALLTSRAGGVISRDFVFANSYINDQSCITGAIA